MLHFPFLSSIPWDSFPLPRASCSMSDIYLLVCHMDISENTHSAFPPTQYHFEIDACYSLQALVSDCCLVFFQKDIPYFNYQFPSRQISQLFPTTAINNAVKSIILIGPVGTCVRLTLRWHFSSVVPGLIGSANSWTLSRPTRSEILEV